MITFFGQKLKLNAYQIEKLCIHLCSLPVSPRAPLGAIKSRSPTDVQANVTLSPAAMITKIPPGLDNFIQPALLARDPMLKSKSDANISKDDPKHPPEEDIKLAVRKSDGTALNVTNYDVTDETKSVSSSISPSETSSSSTATGTPSITSSTTTETTASASTIVTTTTTGTTTTTTNKKEVDGELVKQVPAPVVKDVPEGGAKLPVSDVDAEQEPALGNEGEKGRGGALDEEEMEEENADNADVPLGGQLANPRDRLKGPMKHEEKVVGGLTSEKEKASTEEEHSVLGYLVMFLFGSVVLLLFWRKRQRVKIENISNNVWTARNK